MRFYSSVSMLYLLLNNNIQLTEQNESTDIKCRHEQISTKAIIYFGFYTFNVFVGILLLYSSKNVCKAWLPHTVIPQ